jgi:hypothetical protein
MRRISMNGAGGWWEGGLKEKRARRLLNRAGTSNSQSSKSHNLWLLRESELLQAPRGKASKFWTKIKTPLLKTVMEL